MGKAQRNREQRTAVRSTGVRVRVDGDRLAGMHIPEPVPGQHSWGIYAMWRVTPATYLAGEFELDTENLVTVSPLACLWCELGYSPAVDAAPCAGDPT